MLKMTDLEMTELNVRGVFGGGIRNGHMVAGALEIINGEIKIASENDRSWSKMSEQTVFRWLSHGYFGLLYVSNRKK